MTDNGCGMTYEVKAEFIDVGPDDLVTELLDLERKYGFSSASLVSWVNAGVLPDSAEFIDWQSTIRALEAATDKPFHETLSCHAAPVDTGSVGIRRVASPHG